MTTRLGWTDCHTVLSYFRFFKCLPFHKVYNKLYTHTPTIYINTVFCFHIRRVNVFRLLEVLYDLGTFKFWPTLSERVFLYSHSRRMLIIYKQFLLFWQEKKSKTWKHHTPIYKHGLLSWLHTETAAFHK